MALRNASCDRPPSFDRFAWTLVLGPTTLGAQRRTYSIPEPVVLELPEVDRTTVDLAGNSDIVLVLESTAEEYPN